MEQGTKDRAGSAQVARPRNAAPRYLRFVRALVLGSALVAVPMVMSGCVSGCNNPPDSGAVDGPLPPPDLPLA